jgi:hypothetical protein
LDGLSVGAVGAAIIAAIASFVGLILGKEAKTSEFRQQWIDSLRSEIADYLSNINSIADHLKKTYSNKNEKVQDLIPYYHKLNLASCLIRLRLNPAEEKSRAVLDTMAKFESISKDDGEFTSDKVEEFEREMLGASQTLLKSEWDRVKSGEWTFRLTKYGAMIIAAFLVGLLVYASLQKLGPNDGAKDSDKQTAASQQPPKTLPPPKGSKLLPPPNPPAETDRTLSVNEITNISRE